MEDVSLLYSHYLPIDRARSNEEGLKRTDLQTPHGSLVACNETDEWVGSKIDPAKNEQQYSLATSLPACQKPSEPSSMPPMMMPSLEPYGASTNGDHARRLNREGAEMEASKTAFTPALCTLKS